MFTTALSRRESRTHTGTCTSPCGTATRIIPTCTIGTPTERSQRELLWLPLFNLRANEPRSHVHLAVHPRRHPQVLVGLRLPTRPLEELTEMEVAMRDERPGSECLGQGQRLAVVAVGLLDINGITMGGDLAKQSETPGFVI